MKLLLIVAATTLSSPLAAKTIAVAAGPDAHNRLQTALIDAQPGDTVQMGAGRFELGDGLSLDVSNVTLAGAGPGKTILSFDGQKGEAEGLLVTSNNVVMRGFAVENAKGNGIKSKGSDGISFVDLRVEWTHGPKATNGAYGVYPVASKNVLIDRVFVRGASDAGIYVGQSANIVVQHSRAEGNVAGIEIENSWNADVHDNVATKNAGGILVFDLPNLPQMGGHSVRIYRNEIVANDTPNFASPGNIVAQVQTGTGVMVMANRDVHVFDNHIDGNGSAAVMLVSYRAKFTDKNYNPLPRDVVVAGNRIGRNGFAVTFPGGKELAAALGGTLPPVMWDGVTQFAVPGGALVAAPVRMRIADGPVVNLNLVTQSSEMSAAKPTVVAGIGTDTQLAKPAAVVLPPAQLGLVAAR